MKLWVLVFINALAVALSLSIINFYFQQKWVDFLITFSVSIIITYAVFYYLIERFVYSKIKLIYKLIHNLKLGKDLKDALGEYVSTDPIHDVEQEVKEWARDKKSEIDQLKQQEKFRREFLTNISHELKTPLFAIQGYIEALQDDDINDPELSKQFLEKASKNVDRLAFFIKDLDSISKLESGEIPVNYEKFDLAELIREVIEYGKYAGTTSIKTFELHDQILVEITDNGIGIEEKSLPRLSERFYRTDKSRSREIGGSGLGLAIVKHIIEAHQQTITVRSTENIGSTFGFTLERIK